MRHLFRSVLGDVSLVLKHEVRAGEQPSPWGSILPQIDRWLADPSSRAALLEVHKRTRGAASPAGDMAKVRADLAEALRSGRLVALTRPARKVIVEIEQPETPPEMGPEEEVITWFEVKIVDEVGEPMAGVAVTITVDGKKEKVSTNGAGKAKVEGTGGVASLTFDKETDVRKSLKDLWAKPRNKEWYMVPEGEEGKHTIVQVRRTSALPAVNLLAEETHTVVFQPRIVQANLKGMWFSSSKCFLLHTARHSLQLVKGLYDANHECDMLVVGHTDTEGNDSYNDPLSLERAEATVAYLKDDVDAWYAWYGSGKPQDKRWGKTEDHEMITALAEEEGTIIPPGTSEVKWYQESRGLKVDGIAGEQTRKALIKEYMGLDGTTLPEDIKPVAHGCGEHFPVKKTGDNKNEQENRRVEIFFFENVIAPPDRPDAILPPPPGKNSKKGSKEYPEWLKRVAELHEFEVGQWIRLLMKYEDGTPAKNVPFKIAYSDGVEETQVTSEAGILMVHGVKEKTWNITAIEDESVVTLFQ